MEILKPYRAKIDALDEKIVALLVERFNVVHEVGKIKAAHNIPVILEDRIREVIDRAGERAGMHEDTIREIYTLIVTIACDLEDKIIETHTDIA